MKKPRRIRRDAGEHRKREYLRLSITVRRRWKCICGSYKCRKRVTLAQHPKTFDTERRCAYCGGPLRVDFNRTLRREHRKQNCWCMEAPWSMQGGPHRRGWCEKRQRERAAESA